MVEKARLFAVRAHDGIKRKYTKVGYSPIDYITHPAWVAVEIAGMKCWSTGLMESVVISAAWLHDVVEDTEYTLDDICIHFGDTVAGIVGELTNPSTNRSDLTRAERKEMDRRHIKDISFEALTIKCIDRVHNLSGILVEGPEDFTSLYLYESILLWGVLLKANSVARERLWDVIDTGLKKFLTKRK